MNSYNKKLFVQNLSKTFYTKTQIISVFENISLHVNTGEFVSLIGPSGCGKSTLFNIIAGIENQTCGTVKIDEEINSNLPGKSGYMLQKPLLLPWKTVEENIMLGLLLKHESYKSARLKANDLLKKFDLLDFAKSYPSTLSGGMAQRVAMLRTILFNKDFLLMDEPFGSLDALTRLSCQFWLLNVWKTYKSSILFITHDVSEAILLSDRIYVMGKRTSKIIGEFSVGLPRPRKKKDITSQKAISLEKELLKLIC